MNELFTAALELQEFCARRQWPGRMPPRRAAVAQPSRSPAGNPSAAEFTANRPFDGVRAAAGLSDTAALRKNLNSIPRHPQPDRP
jgi:hypothetical protein